MRFGNAMALGVAMALAAAGSVRAETGTIPEHRFEVGLNGGYMWTFSREVYFANATGDADIRDDAFWGVTLDVNVRPGAQATLLYQRQDSQVTFDATAVPQVDIADVAVEYWHVGGLAGTPKGNLLPYGMFTLGATRMNYKGVDRDDDWRFSVILGFGAKAYLGDRAGIRVQGQIPYTFIGGSGSIACGPAGCITMLGGTGVGQINAGGGVFLSF